MLQVARLRSGRPVFRPTTHFHNSALTTSQIIRLPMIICDPLKTSLAEELLMVCFQKSTRFVASLVGLLSESVLGAEVPEPP